MSGSSVRVRRVYDEASEADGARVLVDRVWPRGMKKEAARLDEWAKAVAPSTELRKWYGHDQDKFAEFRRRYREELRGQDAREAFDGLRERTEHGTVTLLTASKDVEHSQAQVLSELLEG